MIINQGVYSVEEYVKSEILRDYFCTWNNQRIHRILLGFRELKKKFFFLQFCKSLKIIEIIKIF